MNARTLPLVVLTAGLAAAVIAADEKDTKVTSRDALNARILEEAAKKQAANPATTPATTPAAAVKAGKTASPAAKTPDASRKKGADEVSPPNTDGNEAKPKDAAAEKAKAEPATVLPKVEVSRSRINELDRQIIVQEKEIAQEKQNTKPTELDKALNNPKLSKALAIFGGESSQQRATVSSERVKIMVEERDILESMKAARTKEEKADLQKQLDELRAYRRQLEKGLR